MGILTNALVIGLGCLLGSKLRKKQSNYHTLGITIMIISLVGFMENVYNIDGARITSENLMLVLFAFFLGSKPGDLLKLDQRLSYAGKQVEVSDRASLMNVLLTTDCYTIGTGIMPSMLNHGRIISIPYKSDDHYTVGYILRSDRTMSPTTQRFIEILRTIINEK